MADRPAVPMNDQIIEELYLVTLSRIPNQDEVDRDQRFIRAAANQRA